jgi:hypothetical protein
MPILSAGTAEESGQWSVVGGQLSVDERGGQLQPDIERGLWADFVGYKEEAGRRANSTRAFGSIVVDTN